MNQLHDGTRHAHAHLQVGDVGRDGLLRLTHHGPQAPRHGRISGRQLRRLEAGVHVQPLKHLGQVILLGHNGIQLLEGDVALLVSGSLITGRLGATSGRGTHLVTCFTGS